MAKLASALAWGTGAVDWQERINTERMRKERLEKARAALKKHGVAAALVTKTENIRYTTAARGPIFVGLLRYALVFAEHDPILFEHGGTLEHQKIHCPWIKPENLRLARCWLGGIAGREATIEEAKLFAKEIKQALKEKGCENEKLAVDALEDYGIEALKAEGIQVVPGNDIMLEARMIKTQDEINCLKMAAAFADAGLFRIWQEMRPGVRDCDLVAVGAAEIFRMGADGLGTVSLYSGPNCFEQYRGITVSDRIIQPGDLVYVDMVGISHLGYRTCYYRTFKVGADPTPKERDWYKKCVERLDAVLENVKPGKTTAEAALGFPAASTWGYPEEEHVLCGEIAHGIGLYQYEMPVINRQWSLKHPQVFEEGMVFAIESREGEHLVGGARIEDMVVVTKDGAEIITRMFRDDIMVANRMI